MRVAVTVNPLQESATSITPDGIAIQELEWHDATLKPDEALDAYHSRAEFIVIFLSPLFNILFFLIFASCALDHAPIQAMYPAENGLASTLAPSGTDAITPLSPIKFSNMGTKAEIFPWLLNSFIPATFVTTDYNGNNITSTDMLRRVAGVHRIIGAVEFKTYSAPLRSCDPRDPLGHMYSTCHDFNNPVVNSTFYIDAASTAASASAIILAKQASGTWIDDSTASLQINTATFDGELHLLCLINLDAEFQPGGFLQTQDTTKCIPSDPYGTSSAAWPLDISVAVCFILTIFVEGHDYIHYKKLGLRMSYFTVWRGVTWVALVAIVVFYALWTVLVSSLYDATFASNLRILEAHSFSSGIDNESLLGDIMARVKTMKRVMLSVRLSAMAALVLLMFRVLSSLRFHPHLNLVTATLTASLHSLVPFFCIFLICLSAFVTSGCLLFGESLIQFSTVSRSIVTVVNMLFGQFDLPAIFSVDYYTAFVWYWCAMIVLFLVLFNMLLAIVLNAFNNVRKASVKRTEPYVHALQELWLSEGFWLWPWYRPAMIQFGKHLEAGDFDEISIQTVAKQLKISESKAAKVVRKTKAFHTIMSILRDAKSDTEPDDNKQDSFDTVHDRLDSMEILLESKLAAMSANMADLIARIDAKL
ncbi:hypothetical protein AeMF1_012074 [Aphanomyces euteiches]|nr:hypothetical protein AeMF1_012074 [Aphanomyces euteiches]KAH9188195.1 hypothetical protein AeNC1_009832 [Aphanomyces euteiches]